MDVRRRQSKSLGPSKTDSTGGPLNPHHQHQLHYSFKASDALPLPLYLTNGIFFTLFFSVAYFLLHRWREKIRTSTPLHIVTLSELAAVVSLIASLIYLLGFFGIDFFQSMTRASDDADDFIVEEETRCRTCAAADIDCSVVAPVVSRSYTAVTVAEDDEEIIKSVVAGSTPSYSLESKLEDCDRAATIRREAVEGFRRRFWFNQSGFQKEITGSIDRGFQKEILVFSLVRPRDRV